MARGKHSTALFEVIHTAKRPPKAGPTGGRVPAPKWWSKGGGKAARDPEPMPDASPAADPAPPLAAAGGGTRRSWLSTARRAEPPLGHVEPIDSLASDFEDADPAGFDVTPPDAAADPDPAPAEPDIDHHGQTSGIVITKLYPVEAPASPVVDEPAERESWSDRRARIMADRAAAVPPPEPPRFDPTADVSAADLRTAARRRAAVEPVEDEPVAASRPQHRRRSAGPTPSALKPAVDPPVSLDRGAREVRVRLSYAGAILAGVILLLVVVIAFLAGQHTGTAESLATDAPVGSARPVPPSGAAALMAASPTTGGDPTTSPPPAAAMPAVTTHTSSTPPAAPADGAPFARQPNQRYVIAQWYPTAARRTADSASTFLSRNGIPCDVVVGPSGFGMRDCCSVVTRQGFARGDHTSAAADLQQRIAELGPKFSPARVYNQFQPQLYTWKVDSDLSQR